MSSLSIRPSTNPLRIACSPTTPCPRLPISSTHPVLLRHFASSAQYHAQEQDHYAVLGVKRSASRREIKERFYELSKQYHPDAPSTSTTAGSPEDRLALFQSISASYATLSDDSLRRSYDAGLGASAHGRRARYTRGHSGFSSSGVGADARSWSDGENERRRQRANYAWAHPSASARRGSASADARRRADPFAGTSSAGGGAGPGVGGSAESLFRTFAAREAFARDRAAGGMGNGNFGAGANATSAFGDKAEEENRLINDSSTKRTAQVFFMFFGAFALASLLSGSKDSSKRDPRSV